MPVLAASTNDSITWLRDNVIRRGFYVNLVCCFWNMLGDLVYSDMTISGTELISLDLPDIVNRNKNSHQLLLLAQTAGWMYPIWGVLTGWQLYLGLQPAGFYHSTLPCILFAYSFCVIGGAQHSGWAFLTVLWQSPYAEDCVSGGSTVCQHFLDDVQARIWRHFVMGDLPALLLFLSSLWILISVTMNRNKGILFSSPWFNLSNPLVTQMWVFGVVYFLPAPYAGMVGGPFGTWMVLTPNLACAWCLWDYNGVDGDMIRSKKKK